MNKYLWWKSKMATKQLNVTSNCVRDTDERMDKRKRRLTI